MNQAIVFLRRHAALGAGHVGWAFADDGDIFNVGAIENPRGTLRTAPAAMGFWNLRTRDPIEPVRERRYDEFKIIEVEQANPAAARRVVTWVRQKPYDIIGCNCMNATYDVLRAYGVTQLPVPAYHWEPDHWFDHITGKHYCIDQDGISEETGDKKAIVIGAAESDVKSLNTNPPEETPLMPTWRATNTEDAQSFQSAMTTAPAMPQSSAHPHSRPPAESLLTKLRHLLGIGHR